MYVGILFHSIEIMTVEIIIAVNIAPMITVLIEIRVDFAQIEAVEFCIQLVFAQYRRYPITAVLSLYATCRLRSKLQGEGGEQK